MKCKLLCCILKSYTTQDCEGSLRWESKVFIRQLSTFRLKWIWCNLYFALLYITPITLQTEGMDKAEASHTPLLKKKQTCFSDKELLYAACQHSGTLMDVPSLPLPCTDTPHVKALSQRATDEKLCHRSVLKSTRYENWRADLIVSCSCAC